jgi:uncharacterized oxidoreductase
MKTTGNTILVTGATSGIGRAFAERFAALGNTVLACGRRSDRLEELRRANASIVTRVCDISREQERDELARWAIREHPDLNVLINNAGIQLATDLTHTIDLSAVKEEFETNVIAPIHLTSMRAEHLVAKPRGAIVNISSGLAFAPIAAMAVYCATKAAVHSLTVSLRHQLRATNIAVFEIAPPGVDTELGYQHRPDTSKSHGGMPLDEFMTQAMEALEKDRFEAAIGPAAAMREKPDEMFARMNQGR